MDRDTFSIDKRGIITLRGYYHIYKSQYDTQEKAKAFIQHLNHKLWFNGTIKHQTLKAMGLI